MIEYLLLFAVLVLILPMLVVAAECILALLPPVEELSCDQVRPRIAVLIPAHNEETVIAKAIASISPQLERGDRLLVVADNCIDETAAIALRCGAEVVVRNDESCHGKGYALDFGVRMLEKSVQDVVIIIDADCCVSAGSIEILAKKAAYLQLPIQAAYLMKPKQEILSNYEVFIHFAWVIRNFVRPLGANRFGMPCCLRGSGMAFPWDVIRDANLGSSHITEDLKLGIELALVGYPAVFCPEALVTSVFPNDFSIQKLQRKRWEHGYLDLLFRFFPLLCVQATKQRSFSLLALSLDLMVPPLALLGLLLFVGLVIAGSGILFGSAVPFLLLIGAGTLLFVALMLARNVFAKDIISSMELLKFPCYMIMKIPLYIGYFFDKETKWRNTKRD